MSDWVTFEGRVEPLAWGRSTYTILRLPEDVVTALGKSRRVEGEIAEHPVNLALSRGPVVDGVFLWTGQSLLDRIGITARRAWSRSAFAPRPTTALTLTPTSKPRSVRAGSLDQWEALTPGKRRGLLYQISTAKTEKTRLRRIAKLVGSLE
jgi:hypothetical protein